MLVKLGAIIAAASGSIGGIVASRNRGGNYFRNRTIPIQPNTARQVEVKAIMAFLTDRWAQTLTAGQRTAWNLYAASVSMLNSLGEATYHSGFNHYIRSNFIAKMVPYPLVDDGPVVFELPAQDPTFAVTASEATQVLTLAFDDTMDWATEDLAYMFFFQGQPKNPQINFFDGPWRFIGSVGGVDPGGPVEPHAGAAQFAISEGQRQWVYARIMRADGRLSQPFEADTFCAA